MMEHNIHMSLFIVTSPLFLTAGSQNKTLNELTVNTETLLFTVTETEHLYS
jgi:hypothetical protein